MSTPGRLTIGRLQVYVELRDLWVGVYIAPAAVYVCLLPAVVVRWSRDRRVLVNDKDGTLQFAGRTWQAIPAGSHDAVATEPGSSETAGPVDGERSA